MLKNEGYSDKDIQRVSKCQVGYQRARNSADRSITKNATWDTITTSASSGQNNFLSVPLSLPVQPFHFRKSVSRPIISQTNYHPKNTSHNGLKNSIHVVIQPNKKMQDNCCHRCNGKNDDITRSVSSSSCDSSTTNNSFEMRFTNLRMTGKNDIDSFPINTSKEEPSIKIVVEPRFQHSVISTSSMSTLSSTHSSFSQL